MSIKHYQMIADAIKESTNLINLHICDKDRLIYLLCTKLKEDNPNFNDQTFLSACK